MSFKPQTVRSAKRHLRAADPVIGAIIDRVGPFRLTLQPDCFASLARAIVAQQISAAAARTIWGRLMGQMPTASVCPQAIHELGLDQLRLLGVSLQKANYLWDLSEKCSSGEIEFSAFERLSDEEIISHLARVKGIGRWTAQMFLIFSMGRPDVFAPDDLGLRSAIRQAYGLSELPNKAKSLEISQKWSPFSTVASWYLWRSLDAKS